MENDGKKTAPFGDMYLVYPGMEKNHGQQKSNWNLEHT